MKREEGGREGKGRGRRRGGGGERKEEEVKEGVKSPQVEREKGRDKERSQSGLNGNQRDELPWQQG